MARALEGLQVVEVGRRFAASCGMKATAGLSVGMALLGVACGGGQSSPAGTVSNTPVFDSRTPGSPTASSASDPPGFDRGVSYDTFYFPFDVAQEKIENDLQFMKQQGVTSIYFTASEADLQDKRKTDLVLRAGNTLGLRVYLNPYIGGTFSGDEGGSAAQYLQQHPEDEMTSRLGGKSGLPSINSAQYRAFLKETLGAFLRHDFDGVLLDEPSFPEGSPEDYLPYDQASQEKFTQMFGHEMPDVEDQEVMIFRKAAMLEFLTDLLDFIKGTRPDATTILVVLPDFGGRDFIGTADWRSLSQIESLDVFQIDPYWFGHGWEWFVANIDKLMRETSGSRALPGAWVQAFAMDSDYQFISQSLRYLTDQGLTWLAAWMTENAPNADMDRTWREIASVYQQG